MRNRTLKKQYLKISVSRHYFGDDYHAAFAQRKVESPRHRFHPLYGDKRIALFPEIRQYYCSIALSFIHQRFSTVFIDEFWSSTN